MIIKGISRGIDMMPRSRKRSAKDLARRLGWFSVGLGLLEVAAPRRLSRLLGMRGGESTIAFVGIREIGTGIALLSSGDPAPFVWGRVAGDALDILGLLSVVAGGRRKPVAALALTSVAAVTAVDLICAQTLSTDMMRKRYRTPDYSGRTGLQKTASQMRGLAKDCKIPASMQATPLGA
jgi:hypothetical protein